MGGSVKSDAIANKTPYAITPAINGKRLSTGYSSGISAIIPALTIRLSDYARAAIFA